MNAAEITSWTGTYAFGFGQSVRQYLQTLGCGAVLTAYRENDKPDLSIQYNAATETWKFEWINKMRTETLEFRCGEWVDGDMTFDRRPCKTKVTIDPKLGDPSVRNGRAGFVMEQQVSGVNAIIAGDTDTSTVRTRITKLWYGGEIQLEMECSGAYLRQIYRPIYDLEFLLDPANNPWPWDATPGQPARVDEDEFIVLGVAVLPPPADEEDAQEEQQ